jgi:hypothetical protein
MDDARTSPRLYGGFSFLRFGLTINARPRRDQDVPAAEELHEVDVGPVGPGEKRGLCSTAAMSSLGARTPGTAGLPTRSSSVRISFLEHLDVTVPARFARNMCGPASVAGSRAELKLELNST